MSETLAIRRDDPLKFNPLEDVVMDDIPPSVWCGPHVGKRLSEAMRTLRLLPMRTVAGYGAPWPAYSYEFEDLLAQQAQGELEKTMRVQNRTRLLPSFSDVTRMEAAICWPARYLIGQMHLLRAVNCVALAHSLDRDAGWVVVKRGGYADTWRANHDKGCDIVADGLRAELVPVF
ncbi:hypothetical protein QIH77_07650 [Bradyrhizobium diazoefficiens]|uniref:hypothetical protein n=1 Tax=Bradyrhizobium diazoefficiens TaxID=1355477 RepID=UPI00272B12BE|nr:hypothetical protein [Bradyrhizobium diazoefficiens]WLA75063.1 hypothetical protein QIH77_07650 [Bradyrhizobium diazoefficiens]